MSRPEFSLEYGQTLYKTTFVEILLAKNLSTNNTICVKRYKLLNSLQQKNFTNELNSLYRLNSNEGVLKIFGHKINYENGNEVEIYLEYCKEGDLCEVMNKRIAANNPWTDRELLAIITNLVSTFEFLQQEKIAHRDIKPDNILITAEGQFKVSDLGSSTNILINKDNTNYRTIVGTNVYMSPELRNAHLHGSGPDLERQAEYNPFISDVWSLGLTFLILVSLKSIDDFSALNNLDKILKNRLRELHNPLIKKIITSMLIIEPRMRPDFIALKKLIIQFKLESMQCCICNQSVGETIWCCEKYMHPTCYINTDYCCQRCGTSAINQLRQFKCSNCGGNVKLHKVGECNHLLCKKCKSEYVECACCFGLEVGSQQNLTEGFSSLDLKIFTEIYCKYCNKIMQYTQSNKLIYCEECNKYLCAVCKQTHHEGTNYASSESHNDYFPCRCRLWRLKRKSEIFAKCSICNYICVVCYQGGAKSHFSCLQLLHETRCLNIVRDL